MIISTPGEVMKHGILKVMSGGQTGADRAALDAAIASGVEYGGWLPRGRKTEEGPLPLSYKLEELASADYRDRTARNVFDSDGTLLVSHGKLTGGTLLTKIFAEKYNKPWLHLDMRRQSREEALSACEEWLCRNGIEVLNVAGPRASGDPEIYDTVRELIGHILE